MNTFTPKTNIESAKLNANFQGVADGTEISAGAISASNMSPPTWIGFTYQNSWVDYDDGSSLGGGQYYKDHMGIVHLRGLVKNGTTAGATITTLPTGYRPNTREIHCTVANSLICRLDIQEDGTVATYTGGSTTWTSLNGISFRADQ